MKLSNFKELYLSQFLSDLDDSFDQLIRITYVTLSLVLGNGPHKKSLNAIMGTTVDPAGKAFYPGTEWAVSTGNNSPRTCQDLSHTCISHHQSAVCISEYNHSPLESYSPIGA